MHFLSFLKTTGKMKGNKGSSFPPPAASLCFAAGCPTGPAVRLLILMSIILGKMPGSSAPCLLGPRSLPVLPRRIGTWGEVCAGGAQEGWRPLKQHRERLQVLQLLLPALESIAAGYSVCLWLALYCCELLGIRHCCWLVIKLGELQPYLAQPALVPVRNNQQSVFVQSPRAQQGWKQEHSQRRAAAKSRAASCLASVHLHGSAAPAMLQSHSPAPLFFFFSWWL